MLLGVLDAGADTVQLRDLCATPARAAALVAAIGREAPEAQDRLVIHDRLAGPGTVACVRRHVPSASILSRMGARTPGNSSLGASVHSLDEARLAVHLGAAWLTFGHLFRTGSHPGESPRGVEALAEVVADVDLPVLAIGGIAPDNLNQVLATGCAGIAVISAVIAQPDPPSATRRLRELLDTSPHRPRYPFPTFPGSQQKGST